MMTPALLTVARHLLVRATFFMPSATQTRIERDLRGREDFAKLQRADIVIVSFGKSGRTWLRVMMSRFFQLRSGVPERVLLSFDNFHRRNPALPRVFLTHDNYLKDFTGDGQSKAAYHGKRVVLLVRDPADVAVSQYYQWKYRMSARKKRINAYPSDDVPLADFVMRPECGLPKIIDFMNGWARDLGRIKNLLVVRYEDLKADTAGTLAQILAFIGTPGTADEIAEAVRFASVENMRKMERKRVFWRSGSRMTVKDVNNPNAFKVRKAKVGGYRDEFTAEQLDRIDALVRTRLDPVFGYVRDRAPNTGGPPATAAPVAASALER
jgi:hypothetical protein